MKKSLFLIILLTSTPTLPTGNDLPELFQNIASELFQTMANYPVFHISSPQYWDRRLVNTRENPMSAKEYALASIFYGKIEPASKETLKKSLSCLEKYINMVGEEVDSQEYLNAHYFCVKLSDQCKDEQDKLSYFLKGSDYLEKYIQKGENITLTNYRELHDYYEQAYLINSCQEYFKKYLSSFDRYAQMAGEDFNPDNYLNIFVALSYSILISKSLEESEVYLKKGMNIFEKLLEKNIRLNPKNYSSMSIMLTKVAINLAPEDPNKLEYYKKACEYCEKNPSISNQYFICQMIAYIGAGKLSGEAKYFRQAIKLADSFLKENKKNIANINKFGAFLIGAYENAKEAEENPYKIQAYEKNLKFLYQETGIDKTYQVGDKMIGITQAQLAQIHVRAPLNVEIIAESQEDGISVPAELSKTQKKNQRRKQKEKEKKARDKVEKEGAIVAVEIPLEPQVLESLEVSESIESEDEEEATIKEAFPVAPKLTKQEKKQLKLLEETKIRKESSSPVSEIKTSINVDPEMRFKIFNAYQEPQDLNKILGLLEKIENFKNEKVTDRAIDGYLNTLKHLLAGEKVNPTKFNILGINFSYHPAHGSRGGEWDKGMINRFVNFGKNLKTVFKAIMQE